MRTKENICPNCGKKLDALKEIGNDKTSQPRKGDFSICLYCGEILEFDDDLTLKPYSVDNFNSAPQDIRELLINLQNQITHRNN